MAAALYISSVVDSLILQNAPDDDSLMVGEDTDPCCCGGSGMTCCGYDCSTYPRPLFMTISSATNCGCLEDTYELTGSCINTVDGPSMEWRFTGTVCGVDIDILIGCSNPSEGGRFSGLIDGTGANRIQSNLGNPTIESCQPLHLTGTATGTVLGTVTGCTGPFTFDFEVTE